MRQLDFDVIQWLGCNLPAIHDRETFGSLRIVAGRSRVPVTEVYDSSAKTLRDNLYVPLLPLANWLTVNWWRLRWEATPPGIPSADWLAAHSMAAVTSDTPWPPLTLAGDGESIQVAIRAEAEADVAAIRYTQSVNTEIPATDFEDAVDALLDTVIVRLSSWPSTDRELKELVKELREERGDPVQAACCRLQALAGIDPGAATDEWFREVDALQTLAGDKAIDELLATIPIATGGIQAVRDSVDGMMSAKVVLDLSKLPQVIQNQDPAHLPWQRGALLAKELRKSVAWDSGPIDNQELGDLVGARFPLASCQGSRLLTGGYRNGQERGKTAVLLESSRDESQRFFVARLIAAALMSDAEQHVLPVSKATTAFQKAERSFAQELLCPWEDLKQHVDENGTDDDALADAAAHFQVSEYLIRNTLVDKGYLGRDYLPQTLRSRAR